MAEFSRAIGDQIVESFDAPVDNDLVAADLLDEYGFHEQAERLRENLFVVDVGRVRPLKIQSANVKLNGYFTHVDFQYGDVGWNSVGPIRQEVTLRMEFRATGE